MFSMVFCYILSKQRQGFSKERNKKSVKAPITHHQHTTIQSGGLGSLYIDNVLECVCYQNVTLFDNMSVSSSSANYQLVIHL